MSLARRSTVYTVDDDDYIHDASPTAVRSSISPVSRYSVPPKDDEGSPLSPVPASPSEAVLSRCRDTIRRLHAEIEDERSKRLEVTHKLRSAEADVRHLQEELDLEREQGAQTARMESGREEARLEALLAEKEQRLRAQEKTHSATREQLQRAKTAELKATELEGTIRRAEARALHAEEELTRCKARLAAAEGKVSDMEREVAALRAAGHLETERADMATRMADQHRQRCDVQQRELEALQATMQHASRSARDVQQKLADDLERAMREKQSASEAAAAAATLSRDLDTTLESSVAMEHRIQELELGTDRAVHRTSLTESELQLCRAELQEKNGLATEVIGLKLDSSKARQLVSLTESELGICRAELQDHTTAENQVSHLEQELERSMRSARVAEAELSECRKEVQDQIAMKKSMSTWEKESHEAAQKASACEAELCMCKTEMRFPRAEAAAAEAAFEQASGDLQRLRKELSAKAVEVTTAISESTAAHHRALRLEGEHQTAEERVTLLRGQFELQEQLRANLQLELQEQLAQAENVQLKLEDRIATVEERNYQLQDTLKEWHQSHKLRTASPTASSRNPRAASESQVSEASPTASRSSSKVVRKDSALSAVSEQRSDHQGTLRQEVGRKTELHVVNSRTRADSAMSAASEQRPDMQLPTQQGTVRRIELTGVHVDNDLQKGLRHAASERTASAASLPQMFHKSNGFDHHSFEHVEMHQFLEEMRGQHQQRSDEVFELEDTVAKLTVELHSEKACMREHEAVEKQLRKALHSSQDEIDALEDVVEKLQLRYERKLAKSHRQLAERESYEQKLKALLEEEVGVLHHYNKELRDFPRPVSGNLMPPNWQSAQLHRHNNERSAPWSTQSSQHRSMW